MRRESYNRVVDFSREWAVFVSGTAVIAGASLWAGARGRGEDAARWERERRRLLAAEDGGGDPAPLWRGLHRAFGAACAAGGLALGLAASLGRMPRWSLGPGAVRALAGILAAIAALSAAARLSGRGGPSFLDGEPALARPADERAAEALGWVLRAWWLAWGARFLWGSRA